jgi:hypothetical protein
MSEIPRRADAVRALWRRACLLLLAAASGAAASTGAIHGTVVDAGTRLPVAEARVTVLPADVETASGPDGKFVLSDVPAGSYTVLVEAAGFGALARPDVIVRPGRITAVPLELRAVPLDLGEVLVTTDYFWRDESQPTGKTELTAEEVRRAPGAAGDVSRMVQGLPSVGKVNDTSNGLIVRGGSPLENGFFVDGIEVPNINHFPSQGASGGAVGILNVELIDGVAFRAGGFGAAHGDRLSSVTEIALREGNRSEVDAQLELHMAGVGGIVEGPLAGGEGSWLLSARRSYLELVVNAFDTGTSVAPSFGDVLGKAVLDLGPRHRLTALLLWSDDRSRSTAETAEENDMLVYGGQDLEQMTGAVQWRALWGGKGVSTTSLSFSSSRFHEDHFERGTRVHLLENRSNERAFTLRNVNELSLGSGASASFGFEARHVAADLDNRYAAWTDPLGSPVPALEVREAVREARLGAFLSASLRPLPRLTATLGLRGDAFTYSGSAAFSPRLALAWQAGARTWLSASAGVYRQSLPVVLLAQRPENLELHDPWAVHLTLGAEHLLADSLRVTLEAYRKRYERLPLDPGQPGLFLMDELPAGYGFFLGHETLTDMGAALSEGIELSVQKKRTGRFYGMAGASLSRSRARAADGVWRARAYDNRLIFSLEGGYQPRARWELSARWIYAGGPPFTPLDLDASRALGRTVLDAGRIHAERLPAYHSLDLRVDRRFPFRRSSLSAFLGVWNAYSRKNVAGYYWSARDERAAELRQWSLLPILGLKYEL